MGKLTTLNLLPVGTKGVIQKMDADGPIRRRFQDIGLVLGTQVECIGRSPLKDPSAYLIKGAVIAIRADDCKNIVVLTHNTSRQEGIN